MPSSTFPPPSFISILKKIYCYEKFLSGSVLLHSVMYKENYEICCCCLNYLNVIQSRTSFSDKKTGYFSELKELLIQH